jgi:hypothetical protein
MVFERIQSLSEKEFALGDPIHLGSRMSENAISDDDHGIHKLSRLNWKR